MAVFKKEVEKIFSRDPEKYHVDRKAKKIEFRLDVSDYIYNKSTNEYEQAVTFDKLTQLSVLLGTKQINLGGDKESYRYSSYTWDENHFVVIRCNDVKFPGKKGE